MAKESRFSARTRWIVRAVVVVGFISAIAAGLYAMIHMPGESFRGAPAALDPDQRQLAKMLRGHVKALAVDIGPRNALDAGGRNMAAAAAYIEEAWLRQGHTHIRHQSYPIPGLNPAINLEMELLGGALADEIIVVGAHYDTHAGSPGASDNASGVAIMLELSRLMRGRPLARTVRFVAFANEELPYARTELMGSLVYAHKARAKGDKIVTMWSLETLGNFSREPGSQTYAATWLELFYPNTGDFVAFIGDMDSRPAVEEALGAWRGRVAFPSEGLVAPPWLAGTHRSDHWSFWMAGYPGIMITDTAPFRYDDYHKPTDTADKLEYDDMARVTEGLAAILDQIANQ